MRIATNYENFQSEHCMVLEFDFKKFRWELWCTNYYCTHGPDDIFPAYFKWWQIRSAWEAYKKW